MLRLLTDVGSKNGKGQSSVQRREQSHKVRVLCHAVREQTHDSCGNVKFGKNTKTGILA